MEITNKSIIGKKIKIENFLSIEQNIKFHFDNFIPNFAELIDDLFLYKAQFAKYCIFDLTFEFDIQIINKNTFELLEKLDFIYNPEKLERIESDYLWANTSEYLEKYRKEEIENILNLNATKKLFVRLIMNAVNFDELFDDLSNGKRDLSEEFQTNFKTLDRYFPQEFQVIDCCLTDIKNLWKDEEGKYFYG